MFKDDPVFLAKRREIPFIIKALTSKNREEFAEAICRLRQPAHETRSLMLKRIKNVRA